MNSMQSNILTSSVTNKQINKQNKTEKKIKEVIAAPGMIGYACHPSRGR